MSTPDQEFDDQKESRGEETYGLSIPLIREVRHALEDDAPERINALLFELHAADLAELFTALSYDLRHKLTDVLGTKFDAEILAYLSFELRDEILEWLGKEKSAAAIAQLDTDDAVHVIEDLSAADQRELLAALPLDTREEVQEGLAHPEGSAGRLMRKDFVSVPEYWTVGNTIDFLRQNKDLPEDFYVIFIIDPKFKPMGYVLLSRIMHSGRDVKVSDIMNQDIKPFSTATDQEEVAYVFRKYALVEAPVVGHSGRLVGVITVDDVVDVIQEEQEEDLMRLGGVIESDFHSSVASTVGRRFPWLFINLLTAIAASWVITLFEGSIEKIVALAVLMPIIASMGGNAGIQSVTIAVRALTTRELTFGNSFSFIKKEMLIGGANGLLLALVTGVTVALFYSDIGLGLVFSAAMVISMVFAGFAGALLPVFIHKMRIDPAIASGIFLTMVTDIVGFFTFLGLAAWLLL